MINSLLITETKQKYNITQVAYTHLFSPVLFLHYVRILLTHTSSVYGMGWKEHEFLIRWVVEMSVRVELEPDDVCSLHKTFPSIARQDYTRFENEGGSWLLAAIRCLVLFIMFFIYSCTLQYLIWRYTGVREFLWPTARPVISAFSKQSSLFNY